MISKIKAHLILGILFWPFYLIIRNPLEVVSETFFSKYGNPNYKYPGIGGLKNFFNDVLKGFKRYERFNIRVISFEIPKSSVAYDEYNKGFGKYFRTSAAPFVKLITAKHNEKYLFCAIYSDEEHVEENTTRFDLDSCQRMDETKFNKELSKFNLDAKTWFD